MKSHYGLQGNTFLLTLTTLFNGQPTLKRTPRIPLAITETKNKIPFILLTLFAVSVLLNFNPFFPLYDMPHTFYYGLHPVSWFILIFNVGVTLIEWHWLFFQYKFLQEHPSEETRLEEESTPRRN